VEISLSFTQIIRIEEKEDLILFYSVGPIREDSLFYSVGPSREGDVFLLFNSEAPSEK